MAFLETNLWTHFLMGGVGNTAFLKEKNSQRIRINSSIQSTSNHPLSSKKKM